MKVQPQTLKEIANSVLAKLEHLSSDEYKETVHMVDYHGFLKSRLPEEFLASVLDPFNLTADDVQIEVVEVTKDLSHEVHYHEAAYAYCVGMGEKYHVAPPQKAKAFLNDHWFSFNDGDSVEIPQRVKHGFTIEEGGILNFLSVQAPPIVGHGHDDYVRVN